MLPDDVTECMDCGRTISGFGSAYCDRCDPDHTDYPFDHASGRTTPTPDQPRPDAAEMVTLSRQDAERIAMVVNDARLRLKDRGIDRLRRPAIEAAHVAMSAAHAARQGEDTDGR